MTPLTLGAYRLATHMAVPLCSSLLALRLRQGKEDPERLAERRGIASLPRPEGALIWLHGASVGETTALLPLVGRLTQGGRHALMTSGTLTSAEVMAQRLPPLSMHQFAPLDVPAFTRRFFQYWRPSLGLIAESEIWPNMILEAEALNIPLAMINARMSERSFARWQSLRGFAQALIRRFALILAQSEGDAERFLALGARNVLAIGNMKYDVPPPPVDARELAELSGLVAGRRLWVAASTHAGEELAAAHAHRQLRETFPDLLTLIAPRHPERGPAIAAELNALGLSCRLRSRKGRPERDCDVYICDTIGELGLVYRLAGIVFLGKSLYAGETSGGHNPIEPAKLVNALLHGPEIGNFRDVYAALDAEGGAKIVHNTQDLAEALAHMFRDVGLLRAMAQAAAQSVEKRCGAVDRALIALAPELAAL